MEGPLHHGLDCLGPVHHPLELPGTDKMNFINVCGMREHNGDTSVSL